MNTHMLNIQFGKLHDLYVNSITKPESFEQKPTQLSDCPREIVEMCQLLEYLKSPKRISIDTLEKFQEAIEDVYDPSSERTLFAAGLEADEILDTINVMMSQGATLDIEVVVQDYYNILLKSDGGNKVAAIKAVRAVRPELGLKEAKDLVESAPVAVLEGADMNQSIHAMNVLSEAGARVESVTDEDIWDEINAQVAADMAEEDSYDDSDDVFEAQREEELL